MPKKKLPEPLVGWVAEPWMKGNWDQEVIRECNDYDDDFPAALCPLPRLPRKGERVECRIVPATKKRKPKPIEWWQGETGKAKKKARKK